MANLPSPDSSLFLINPDLKAKYEAKFRQFCPSGDFISGDQAKQIMLKSGLPPLILAHIWSLADVDADGRMDVNEFSIALHLIALKLKGVELPKTLPQSLKILVEPPKFAAFTNDLPNNTPTMNSATQLVHSNSITSPSSSMPAKMNSLNNLNQQQQQQQQSPKNISTAEWAIPQQSKLKYTQLFNQHDRSRSGFLTGIQARNILLESKLPQAKLAQIWGLADVDADGRLICEEFVLAMHLIDKARMNEPLPTKLPPDLVPPFYRRTSTSGTLSHTSSVEDNAVEVNDLNSISKSSFEDKRRENFEKGQAELDRRRAALAEQQKRERDERERKEREENARKEKERLEAERKRQEEIERTQQRLREMELEKEEQKRRANEVRELARREMERQRQRELEQARRTELMNQRGRLLEEVQKLKSRRKALTIEHEQIDKRIAENKAAAQASRDKVVRVKSEIDGMRTKRDETMAKQNAIKNQMKTFTEKQLFIEQEKVKLSAQLKTLFANTSNGINSDQQMTSFASMLQAKQLSINQLRAHLERYEQEFKSKRDDLINGKRELEELKRRFETKRKEAKNFGNQIEAKRVEGERVRDSGGDFSANFSAPTSNATTAAPAFSTAEVEVMSVPQFDWPANKTTQEVSFAPTTTQTKFKYRCIYEFEARNGDEITIKPGDIVMVDTSAASEPEWLSGEINGKVGWFPQGYAELIDENGDSVNAHVEPPKDMAYEFTAALAAATATASEKTATLKRAKALYDLTGQEPGHISFLQGDLIRVTDQHDSWCYGEIVDSSGKVTANGWFPENYVQILPDTLDNTAAPSGDSTSGSADQYFVSLYAFESIEKGDLEFGIDELIFVEKKDGDWWTGIVVNRVTGELDQSRKGIFPSNFVRPALPDEIPSATKTAPTTVAVAAASAVPPPKEPEMKPHQPLDRKESETGESPKPKKSKSKKVEIVTAIAPYTASGAEQLSLEVGQLITVRKKMASGWWEGELQAKGKKKQVGWFPASYVKPLGGVGGAATAAPASVGSGGSSARATPDLGAKSATDEPEIERVSALYSFKAEREDEISIEANDTIRVLSKPDPTWWRGHNIRTGAIGLFPSNHVGPVNGSGKADAEPQQNYYDNHYDTDASTAYHNYDSVEQTDEWSADAAIPSSTTTSQHAAQSEEYYSSQANSSDHNNSDTNHHRYDQVAASQYPYDDSFDDDDEDEEDGGNHLNGAAVIPTIRQPTNGNTESNVPGQYYTDDSFESDEDMEQNGLSVENSPLSSNSPSMSSLYRKSPQLYTVRIMDTERGAEQSNNSRQVPNVTHDRASQQRLNIIYELITTEEVYINDLYFTLEKFRKPLLECRLFASDEIESFFSHLDEIYEVNYNFYDDLNHRLQSEENASSPRFCDILLRALRQMLPVYKRFCAGQMLTSRQLQIKLESDAQFSEVLQNISKKNKAHLPLSSYLLKPMQRITKYPLLIEKLFDCTATSHPDYKECEQTVKFAKSFCKEINEACRDTENFEKLIWLQKHITIPSKNLDHIIDFNSETQFLGPRTLLHSGILIKASSSKVLAAFLFNDFLLLAFPNKKFQKSLSSANFFYNQKALEITYTLYRKPFLLDEFVITNIPEFESSLDPGLFRIYIKSQKRNLSLRTNSANECVLWLKQIDLAKRNFADIQRRLNNNENIKSLLPAHAPVATLFLTIVEALQLYTRNYALNAYCKVTIGKDASSVHLTKRTQTVRLDVSKHTLRKSKANLTNEGTFKIAWNANFKINIANLDETLFISCYDENPYAPHQCLGEAAIPLDDIVQQRRYVNGSITKSVSLRIPNEQLSKNLLNNYNIKPSVLIKFDLLKFAPDS